MASYAIECAECGETIGQSDVPFPPTATILCPECVTGSEEEEEEPDK